MRSLLGDQFAVVEPHRLRSWSPSADARPSRHVPHPLSSLREQGVRIDASASGERGNEMGLFGGRKREKRLEGAGVNTQAVLVSFREVGQQNFTPLVDLTLRIAPADGSGPFEVTTRGQVQFSVIGKLQPGDTITVRYDPEDHENYEVVGEWEFSGARAAGGEANVDSASAGDIAAAVQATGETGQKKSAAELLATGQRMTAVLREFSPSGKTVGELDPSLPGPNDPVYVIKAELPIDGSTPIETVFMNRVPEGKVADLRLGAHMTVAVNPANPAHEVTIDWASSPVAA